jgi:hypothetical protein
MAITVKKKMTVKTVKAVKPPDGADSPAPDVAVATAAPVKGKKGKKGKPAKGVPVQAQGVPIQKPVSYTFAAMVGLLAVCLIIAVLVLQYFEWEDYHRYPTVFNLPVDPMAMPVAPSGGSLVADDEPFDDSMGGTLKPDEGADDDADDGFQ